MALPGMSGFVAELMVFVGFAISDTYTLTFKIIVITLAAIGVVLTPIYLLSMLREIFYGSENQHLTSHEALVDAEPREVFIIACLLIPIIGIGFYPKLLTKVYDSTTIAITQILDNSLNKLTLPQSYRAIMISEATVRAPEIPGLIQGIH
jgi:NAD(P)H-quinone oxidoreductase subunit 4